MGESHEFDLFFCLIAGNFRREPFNMSQYRKTISLRGLGHEFLWKNFCLSVPNFFLVDRSVFQKKSDSQKTLRKHIGAGITRCRRKFFSHYQENSQENPSVL